MANGRSNSQVAGTTATAHIGVPASPLFALFAFSIIGAVYDL
jgi:hypothetical protein